MAFLIFTPVLNFFFLVHLFFVSFGDTHTATATTVILIGGLIYCIAILGKIRHGVDYTDIRECDT